MAPLLFLRELGATGRGAPGVDGGALEPARVTKEQDRCRCDPRFPESENCCSLCPRQTAASFSDSRSGRTIGRRRSSARVHRQSLLRIRAAELRSAYPRRRWCCRYA